MPARGPDPLAQQSRMGSATLWVILAVVAFDLFLLPLIIWAIVNGSWTPLVKRFGHTAPAPDAVRRNFQSYKVGLLNLGLMIHTAVDDQHLHLIPAALGRWMRMRPVSIPWDDIEPRKLGKRAATIKVAGETVHGPAWALGLAFEQPAPDAKTPDV